MKPLFPLLFTAAAALSLPAAAAPVTYDIDPSHTYPSFEADHMGGLSTWRGKFNQTSGVIVLDREARRGTIDITVQIGSIDFGHDEMNRHAVAPDIFDEIGRATWRERECQYVYISVDRVTVKKKKTTIQ